MSVSMLGFTQITLYAASDDTKTLTLMTNLYPAARDAHVFPAAIDFDWGVKIGTATVYAPGIPVGESDRIEWTTPRSATPKHGNLKYAGETYGPLAQRTFHFNEAAAGS